MVEAYEAGDRQYSYLDNVDLTKVKAVLDEKQKHLDYFVAAVKDKGPTDDPTVFTADLFKSYQVRLLYPLLFSSPHLFTSYFTLIGCLAILIDDCTHSCHQPIFSLHFVGGGGALQFNQTPTLDCVYLNCQSGPFPHP